MSQHDLLGAMSNGEWVDCCERCEGEETGGPNDINGRPGKGHSPGFEYEHRFATASRYVTRILGTGWLYITKSLVDAPRWVGCDL